MTVDASGVVQRSSCEACVIIGQFFKMHCTEMNTDVDEVEYITVGVGELRITNTSNGNGNDKRMVRCERLSPCLVDVNFVE